MSDVLFESDEKLYAVIGKNIKKYRTIAGLTQVQLCEKTGISLSYLTKRESDGVCSFLSKEGRCTIHEFRPFYLGPPLDDAI